MFDKSKANVIERGGHTLFMFTAKKADGSDRDPELARQQLATILNVPLVKVVVNHDYKDKPKGIAYVFRFKKALPARVHSPSEKKGEKGRFIAKEIVFHFPEAEQPAKKTETVFEAMPGTEDDEPEEVDAPTQAGSNTLETILTRILDRQDEQARQMELLAEIIRVAALKGMI